MTRPDLERLAAFADQQGIPLDGEATRRIEAFVSLLEVWNRRTRLTGDRDIQTIVTKHCADSLAVASHVQSGDSVADLGSGAGFPGIVVACVRPDVEITLVDSKQLACSFLDSVAASLRLGNVRVLNARFESLLGADGVAAGSFHMVVSRGVDLGPHLREIRHLLTASGELVLMLSGSQEAPREALAEAGLRRLGERSYVLPQGQPRRLAIYAPA